MASDLARSEAIRAVGEDRATSAQVALVRAGLERYARIGTGLARREAVWALEERRDEGYVPDAVRWYGTGPGNHRV